MLGLDALERDSSAGDRAGDQECAGFDPIGNDVVLRAVQFLHAFDDDAPRARAFDLRAHLVEEIREIHDLRFGGGAFDHGHAFGEHGGHHHVVGAEHGRAEFAAQIDRRRRSVRREHFDVAAFDADRRAERFESFQMQIDRPIADDAAAGQRDGRFLSPAEQRTEHADRRAHFAHDLVGRDRVDLLGLSR